MTAPRAAPAARAEVDKSAKVFRVASIIKSGRVLFWVGTVNSTASLAAEGESVPVKSN